MITDIDGQTAKLVNRQLITRAISAIRHKNHVGARVFCEQSLNFSGVTITIDEIHASRNALLRAVRVSSMIVLENVHGRQFSLEHQTFIDISDYASGVGIRFDEGQSLLYAVEWYRLSIIKMQCDDTSYLDKLCLSEEMNNLNAVLGVNLSALFKFVG